MAKVIPILRDRVPFFRNQPKTAGISVARYELFRESERLRTFEDHKWTNRNVVKEDLARLGFYFFKHPDYVRCTFCFIELNSFEPNDNVLEEHMKFSPNCPLLKRRETRNEPIDHAELNRILPEAINDECGMSQRRRSRVEDDVAHPEYRLPSQRFKSFDAWPLALNQKPEDLAMAGFFYTGRSDFTICFSCGVLIGNWEPNDNPWVEHKKLLIKPCSFLQLNQDQLELNEKSYEQSKRPLCKDKMQRQISKEDELESEKDFDSRCKICLDKKSSIVILPCKHVAVCGQCIFGVGDTCPICRTPIEETISLIYS